MQKFTLIVLAALLAISTASRPYAPVSYPAPAPYYSKPSYNIKESYDYAAPAYYNFDYSVKDGYYNDYGHQESRNGDNTKGSYSVVLPDGRRQIVTYYVDGHSGFVADVRYEGEYNKKTYDHHYKPAYKPSKPSYYTSKPSYY